MSLRSLPLRLKLVIALVLPMLLVTVLIGDRVSNSFGERSVAAAQQDEAARLEAVADFADAVGAESVLTNDRGATTDQLAAARLASDAALDQLNDPSLGLDAEVIRRAGVHHADLLEIRELVGNRPADISLRFQLESYVDPNADGNAPTTMAGAVPDAIAQLSKLPGTIAAEFEFADEAVVDVETSRLLSDYALVQRLRDDHVQEVSVLLQLVATPPSLVDGAAIESYRERVIESNVSRALIEDYADEDLVSAVSASRRSPAGAEYAQLRGAADNTEPGAERMSDIGAVNRSASVITAQYAQFSDEVVKSIRAQSESTADAATTSLVLVLLAGAWMLIIAVIILGLLYRAIRAPLKRLTEQSQHIANVELPYVVSAMRAGDLEQAPTTTDLVADANDEIGELVRAFNDMHRTAVELAAEQAGSRRVVADMFVNLGRRNQRLVNRLLKRLTILERDERDPDKLAGLYEIDHVVTRMRRNAESLLVLAGASQSRKWDRPVEVYNIAQAALSEVEGYERVEIIASDDFQIHGDVVSDLTHLLAEVVENALSFSPPSAAVGVSIHRVGDDHLVSVGDLGVGMTEAQLAEANDRIRRAGTEEETPSEFLGHYVIGRLAARHGIEVRLSAGLEGRGLVADVLIPVGAVVLAAGELVDEFDATAGMVERAAPSSASAAADSTPAPASMPPAAPAVVPEPILVAAHAAAVPVDSARPDWSSVTHEVRNTAPVAETFGQQQRRVPVSAQPAAAPAPTLVTTPSETVPSVARLATPPAGSSFDYPPADQIDPRQREFAQRSAARPPPADSGPSEPAPPTDLGAARSSAADAVEGALSAFGSARRTPGAALPDTSLTAMISGRMTLEVDTPPTVPPPAPATTPLTAPTPDPAPDPNEIRFQLSGFQSGTSRADREN